MGATHTLHERSPNGLALADSEQATPAQIGGRTTVNAVEDCVASESDTASTERSTAHSPAANMPARPTDRRTDRSFEGRLLSRLITFLGDPPLEFVLWTGEAVRPAIAVEPVARVLIEDRAALYGLLADPQ